MPSPERLVEGTLRHYGRFAAPPAVVNPLDEHSGLSRLLRRARLKEWVGFMVTHPDWRLSFIMQEAQYLASSVFYAYDRRRRVLHERTGVRRGGSLALPAGLLEGVCAFRSRGYELVFEFSQRRGRHRLRVDLGDIRGTLELDARRASPPLSVSARLASGGAMYTHKAVFPVEGTLRIGGVEVVFDPARDLAILDEHKSFFPYRTRWQWGTFAMFTPEGFVGANFADHAMAAGHEEESCVWTPRACEPLADVRFEQASAAPLARWRASSRDGRLDVTFEPEARKVEKRQLGVASVDYFQLVGRFTGTLRGAYRTYAVEGVPGVCERMRARF